MCHVWPVTIPRMVTIQLQPFLSYFLSYLYLALKNSYRTGIWLSNIITGRKFGFEMWEDNNNEGKGELETKRGGGPPSRVNNLFFLTKKRKKCSEYSETCRKVKP